jgi:hypothetical protein
VDKDSLQFATGEGRGRIALRAVRMGNDLVVLIYNENAHLGAIAVGEWDSSHQRATVSIHTRLGHKDDAVAQRAAYAISKTTRRSSCVIAGIHLDNITREEIETVLANTDLAVAQLVASLESPPP